MKADKAYGLAMARLLGRIPTALMALVVAGAAFYWPTTALAADHRDSPTADANGEGDITDIFAFLDPNDASQLVLIMDVNPFAVPAETPPTGSRRIFSINSRLPTTRMPWRIWSIQAVFTNVATSHVRFRPEGDDLWAVATRHYTGVTNSVLTGTPTVTGCTGANTPARQHAGVHRFARRPVCGRYRPVESHSRRAIRTCSATFRVLLSERFSGRTVRSDNTSGVDGFGGFNVSIASRLNSRRARCRGLPWRQGMVGIWATTSMPGKPDEISSAMVAARILNYTQFQRVGQQLFKTVFVPSTMREAFNASAPENDMQNWSSLVPDTLTTTDNDGTGNTIAGRAGLLTALGFTDASGANPGVGHGAPLLLPATFNNTNREPAHGRVVAGCTPARPQSASHRACPSGSGRGWRKCAIRNSVLGVISGSRMDAARRYRHRHPAAICAAACRRQFPGKYRRAWQRTGARQRR